MHEDVDTLLEAVRDRQRRHAREPWSIKPILLRPWHVRILLVADGAGSFGDDDLGLRGVVECLDHPAAPWARCEVTTAHRAGDPTADVQGFRFDGHELTAFDEIWLIGTAGPAGPALAAAEARALTAFMDSGGGVFATGDAGDRGRRGPGGRPERVIAQGTSHARLVRRS